MCAALGPPYAVKKYIVPIGLVHGNVTHVHHIHLRRRRSPRRRPSTANSAAPLPSTDDALSRQSQQSRPKQP
jgi:hypothetical protein